MKYLITGNKGQLGKEFQAKLTGHDNDVIGFDLDFLDISDKSKLREFLFSVKPDIIINCAAYNSVDEAENNENAAYSANVLGVKNLAEMSAEMKSFLIHFSTDYVFDGSAQRPYTEEDETNPKSKYGKSKLLGEMAVNEVCENYLIFRTSWLYGEGTQNFIYKFLNWSKSNQQIKVAGNEISVPTYTADLVEFTLISMRMGLKGLFHLVSSNYCSRHQWAKKIAENLNLNNEIIEVDKEIFALAAHRPDFSAMSNAYLSSLLDIEIPEWENALKRFLSKSKF